MRILIALTYYRPHYSGLTIYAEREARALAARGHHVTILSSRYNKNLPAHEKLDGVEVVRLDVRMRISKGVIMPGLPYWAWKLVRQADIVNLHVPQLDAAPIAIISRALGKPVVLTYQCDLRLPSGSIHSIANRVSNIANHITASAASVIVHITRDYAENSPFLRRYIDKVQYIFPPIEVAKAADADIRAFRKRCDIRSGQRIIGMAARLASEKGVEYLAEALMLVLKEVPKARVLFVGPHHNVIGEEDYALRLAPIIERLDDHWSFLGILTPEEMTAFFQESEVLVLPSINSTEAFGLVQVESMGCGTPVVASDIPGVRVPVEVTRMGIIVPPGNARELARALIAVLKNPNAYRGEPEALMQLTTPDSVAAQYEAIFNTLIDQKRE
ncbi:glycosyltransferase family 4 protein [Chloroflexota bacterium]